MCFCALTLGLSKRAFPLPLLRRRAPLAMLGQMNGPHRPPVTAVLGPTNTGKTHLAVERMAAHSSGMIGFPLRLLAREVYDRVVAMKGLSEVALLTDKTQGHGASRRIAEQVAAAAALVALGVENSHD